MDEKIIKYVNYISLKLCERERERVWLGSKNGSRSCVQICEGQFLRTRSSPVWLVVLRAEHGCGEGSYRGAGLAHQQEELSVKQAPVPAETRSFQVCPSSLGKWVRILGRKAEEVSPPPGREVGAGELKNVLVQV